MKHLYPGLMEPTAVTRLCNSDELVVAYNLLLLSNDQVGLKSCADHLQLIHIYLYNCLELGTAFRWIRNDGETRNFLWSKAEIFNFIVIWYYILNRLEILIWRGVMLNDNFERIVAGNWPICWTETRKKNYLIRTSNN